MVSLQLSPPFSVEHQLNMELSEDHGCSRRHLPGYPHIALDDRRSIWNLLNKEFCSDDLDKMADKLWWMSKQDSTSISPLHRQRVKRRAIVVTEDPKLHLVWIHDRVSRDTQHHRRVREAILGYLRTYRYLVRYESDFRIALEPDLQLIPSDVTWEQFCHFGADLMSIGDSDVSARYCYGEIRLTRLNFYAPTLLRKSYFQRVEYQHGAYFARFYGPILFWLGILSVVLSGLQVAVAVEEQSIREGRALSVFALGFSIATVVFSWGLLFFLALVLVYKVAKEWRFAIHDRMRVLKERNKDSELSL
ncbi:hypothetical protein PGQ11_010265 [Apiospora arundinis]|uniref:Uncharacterized protein n=1 Tax=Apiospora arundinis TaxID=335852 RepID=A0ABR2I9B4_9PEZI